MNYAKLEQYLQESELNTASLLTCNFDPIAFSAIRDSLDNTMIFLGENLIKYRKHLRPEGITLAALNDKFRRLERTSDSFKGSADKPFGYVGVHLNESDSFFGTLDKPVSTNEFDYLYKRGWAVKAINPIFQDYANLSGGEEAFICTPQFNLESITDKDGVKSVKDGFINLRGNKKVPIVIVE